jgi:hypothetical protein
MAKTLREAHRELTAKGTFKMKSPYIVWLFENPASPLALPGSISLEKHDYVHCLLDKNLSLASEAYVIGFTMGCDPRTNDFHLWLFKILSCYLYPRQYRFSLDKHWPIFMEAFTLGRESRIGDLEEIDFSSWLDRSIEQLRQHILGSPFSPAD